MSGSPDMLTAGIKMVVSLGVVLTIIFLLLYGMRKLSGHRIGNAGGKLIQVLESHYMGVKKNISLIRVPGKVLVVGISGDRISLLETLDEKIVHENLPVGESKSFRPILSDRLKKLSDEFKGKDGG